MERRDRMRISTAQKFGWGSQAQTGRRFVLRIFMVILSLEKLRQVVFFACLHLTVTHTVPHTAPCHPQSLPPPQTSGSAPQTPTTKPPQSVSQRPPPQKSLLTTRSPPLPLPQMLYSAPGPLLVLTTSGSPSPPSTFLHLPLLPSSVWVSRL